MLSEQPRFIWQSPHWPDLVWQGERLKNPLHRARTRQGRLLAKIDALRFKQGFLTLLPQGRFAGDGILDVLEDATRHCMQPLTAERIKRWHAILFPPSCPGITDVGVGEWRGKETMHIASRKGEQIVALHYLAPPGETLDTEMGWFLNWWETSLGNLDGLLRAGLAHLYFVTIHPFEDGNGRIARALTDMALAQDEQMTDRYYYLSTQLQTENNACFDALEDTRNGRGDVTAWLEYFLGCFERALFDSERLVDSILA